MTWATCTTELPSNTASTRTTLPPPGTRSTAQMRIPRHPSIVRLDRLVVDTADGLDKVVGFTTPFVPGGTVLDSVSRVFTFKYLKKLVEGIDYLNLELGISMAIYARTTSSSVPKQASWKSLPSTWPLSSAGKAMCRIDMPFVAMMRIATMSNTPFLPSTKSSTRVLHFREENAPPMS
ncbi:hypothetical protein QBC33DRAFT_197215 [Phialemonium atrogriseum]|uniref:Uncharacterized protein n=1 Tax=Phialemonium atrogriseum TaxID=1093897 RepID=A0AAJ0BWF3_9PEZI|nr:uncharacterized protein QBC33DRAFT_197215 [Phialemonium atrogriseum]KAK1764359.1 hypothetical protein QBC33DRAFT_197215 [Phialemonium atrogriseum]